LILLAFGANLPSKFGSPERTIQHALRTLERHGVSVVASSSTWVTEPVPVSSQPLYYNSVVIVETALSAHDLLALVKSVELSYGRKQGPRNAARVLDIDILAYNEQIIDDPFIQIPHPRMQERGFVLFPLKEVAPDWKHPIFKRSLDDLISLLPPSQHLEKKQAAVA